MKRMQWFLTRLAQRRCGRLALSCVLAACLLLTATAEAARIGAPHVAEAARTDATETADFDG